jgi:hypothetical protein
VLVLRCAPPPCLPLPRTGGSAELVTRAAGDVRDAIGRPVEAGQLAAVDPECRAIALHLYDGQLKVGWLVWGGGMVPGWLWQAV